MCAPISTILYCVIQLVALAAAAIATPFDMFRPSEDYDYKSTYCLTLWGEKDECYSNKYDVYSKALWAACPERQRRFQFAQAAALISIGVLLLGLLFGFCAMGCCPCCRPLNMVLNVVAAAAMMAVVGTMADSYYNRRGPEGVIRCAAFRDASVYTLKYGAGFALFIVSFILAICNIFVLVIPY